MSDSSSRVRARRDIQGLRAVAVVAVVLDHALGWPGGGFVGVDVFFVISGFLITAAMLRELAASGRVSLGAFYARRVRRILPAALLVLAAVTVAAFFVFHRARADQTLWDAVWAAVFAANWRFAAQGTDYFALGDAVSPLQHFWSLSVEEQFYLVWPGLVLVAVLLVPAAARRTRARGVIAVLAAIVLLGSAAVAWVQTPADPSLAYFSTLTRAGELATGALLAVAAPALGRLPAAVRGLLGWAGLAIVLSSFLAIDAASPFPAPWAALPVAGAALVIAGGVGGDPRARHLFPLSNPVSVVVGDMSYSLYLWHFPVIVFAAVLLPPSPVATALVLGAIAILTVATYLGVEDPLRRAPWSRRVGVDESVPEPQPMPEPMTQPQPIAPAPVRSFGKRPEGWVPGSRYFPGSPSVARPAVEAPRPAEPPQIVRPPASDPVEVGDEPSPWTQWRSRHLPRMGLAATVLALGAGALTVVVLATFATPVIEAPVGAPAVAESEDPTGALQAELAAAVTATEWPALRPSLDDVIARSSADNPAHDCFAPDVPLDAGRCTWGDPSAARHMYLVGDSSAMAYAPAFKKLAEESGGAWRVTTAGMYGCRFTDVLVENGGDGVMQACPQRKADVRALVAAAPADLVVVSNAYTLGRTVDGRDLDAAALQAATQAELSAYGAAGRIVYLAPPPHGADLGRCYSPLNAPSRCLAAIDQTWYDMQAAAEATAAASGDQAVSSLPISCWEGTCPAFAGTLPVRYDDTHLTVAYAEHATPWLRWTLSSRGLY